jgi:hypothetical protein
VTATALAEYFVAVEPYSVKFHCRSFCAPLAAPIARSTPGSRFQAIFASIGSSARSPGFGSRWMRDHAEPHSELLDASLRPKRFGLPVDARAHRCLQLLIERKNEGRLPKWLGFGRHRVPFLRLPDPTARVGSIRLDQRAHRLTPATPAVSVIRDGPPAWEVKREAGASSLNAGAAPATVSDEPQAGATGNSREGG